MVRGRFAHLATVVAASLPRSIDTTAQIRATFTAIKHEPTPTSACLRGLVMPDATRRHPLVRRPLSHRLRAAVVAAAAALSLTAVAVTTPHTAPATAITAATAAATPTSHTVTFDQNSLLLDGQRTFIWSG